MQIKEIFTKDIHRNIDPAVDVGKIDPQTIQTEIEEYVFTPDLIGNLYKFLYEIFNRKEGKTAIWINGFYGSGKSHFIKYAHYCFNAETREAAFEHFSKNAGEISDPFSDATPSNISLLKKKVDESAGDNIMFNIDAVSGMRDRKDKLPIIILNQFNDFRGYNKKSINLAILVEKHLDKIGKFNEFREKINSLGSGYSWEKNAHELTTLKLDQILDVVCELDPTIDKDSLRQKLKTPDDITIEGDLIPELIEYLDSKPESYRLIFLVDEVSQYIGTDTSLLLNLQTIVEEIAANCDNKVWFATTAQQTIDEVIQDADNGGRDFGKILGRFETRISLQSQDADYITKRRVLDKNSTGIGDLDSYYKTNHEAINNQYHFSHELYKGYESKDEFNLSYPFIPYQFRLISDVFESFSNLSYVEKEIRDNERSVLGITHFTLRKVGEHSVGYFVPFDAFFNEMFRTNLTHIAERVVNRAIKLDFVQSDGFAIRVVYTLFMISNLSDHKRITFPANLDNLCLLLMDKPDTNHLDLQRKIQRVLDKLSEKNIIREEAGQYHFFKEDEIEVAQLIQSTSITMEDRLTNLYQAMFTDMLNIKRRFSFGTNNFNLSVSFDDKQIFPKGDIPVTFSFYNKDDIQQRALALNRNDMVVCLNVPLEQDKGLLSDFNQFVKTRIYIRQNSDTASGTRRKTLDDFATRNQSKLRELVKRFEKAFLQSPIISAQSVVQPESIKNIDPKSRYTQLLENHFSNVYKKQALVKTYAKTQDDLFKSANDRQLISDKTLTTAEEEVNNWINLQGDSANVYETIQHFAKPPFGWRDLSTLDVLIHLVRKDKRQFEWHNEKIDLPEFYNHGVKKPERSSINIKTVGVVDIQLIKDAIEAYRSIFNESLEYQDEANPVFEEIQKKLGQKSAVFHPLSETYATEVWASHFRTFTAAIDELDGLREPKRLFESIIDRSSDLKKLRDNALELQEFVESHINSYKTIQEFTAINHDNFNQLDSDERNKADKLNTYFNSPDLPGDKLPQIKKIYQELEQSLAKLKSDLKEIVIKEYTAIYKVVDAHATKSKVAEPETIYTPGDDYIKRLSDENNLGQLRLYLERATSHQAECLKAIDSHIGKQSVTINISRCGLPSKIDNETELDDYLAKLKSKMLSELKSGKSVIIE